MSYKMIAELNKQEPKAMRDVFAATMTQIAEEDERIAYMDADLMNSFGMVPFSKQFPERTINCGIQEANMIGVAAGLSVTGKVPYVHTFGVFASRRVADQVFISAGFAKANIRIIGSDPGITASFNGGTHMPFEDMGMLRCIPGITVIEPTDSVMLADMIRQLKDTYGVYYIRLSRKNAVQVYEEGSTFTIGKAALVREGTDVSILATGICVADARTAAETLAKEGISARIVNMFTVKPVDRDEIEKCARETGCIVTAENHNIIGGLGSAVAEALVETCPVPMERVGVQDQFGEVGSVEYLKERFKLTPEEIVRKAKIAIARKNKSGR